MTNWENIFTTLSQVTARKKQICRKMTEGHNKAVYSERNTVAIKLKKTLTLSQWKEWKLNCTFHSYMPFLHPCTGQRGLLLYC